MQNNIGPKAPAKVTEDTLSTPQPPKSVEFSPEAEGIAIVSQAKEKQAEVAQGLNNGQDKVQDRDWNNGKPEVTKKDIPPLPSHQNPEKQNEDSLRENKGNKPGEEPFEASEEVNTGQSGG